MSHSECTFPAAAGRVGTPRCGGRAAFSGAIGDAGRSSVTHSGIPPALRAVTAQRAVPTLAGFWVAVLLFLIQLYRWTLSPAKVLLFGGDCGCRFTPSCSQYAAGAIRHHGAFAGGWLAVKRICRCHPMGGCGYDPVPRERKEEALISNG